MQLVARSEQRLPTVTLTYVKLGYAPCASLRLLGDGGRNTNAESYSFFQIYCVSKITAIARKRFEIRISQAAKFCEKKQRC